MKDKKAFTLIELIAVLVILAILALIVTPLVLNVVYKAEDSANKRSVDGYGRAVELAVAIYLLENNKYPLHQSDLEIEYTGNKVTCNVMKLNENDGLYLSECSVGGKEVKDSRTDDGFYHYGKTSASVYKSYNIGDQITYNGMNFYVIENSDKAKNTVTMLKAEPLSVDEVNTYGEGHINRYTYSLVGTASNNNGYGLMAYYSSETCGYLNGSQVETGCTTDYSQSDVKYVVDAWAKDKFKSADLSVDTTGYKARLITKEELLGNLGYNHAEEGLSSYLILNPEYTPSWVYNNKYWYWTMSPYDNSPLNVWNVDYYGGLDHYNVYYNYSGAVRPVVTLKKSVL